MRPVLQCVHHYYSVRKWKQALRLESTYFALRLGKVLRKNQNMSLKSLSGPVHCLLQIKYASQLMQVPACLIDFLPMYCQWSFWELFQGNISYSNSERNISVTRKFPWKERKVWYHFISPILLGPRNDRASRKGSMLLLTPIPSLF